MILIAFQMFRWTCPNTNQSIIEFSYFSIERRMYTYNVHVHPIEVAGEKFTTSKTTFEWICVYSISVLIQFLVGHSHNAIRFRSK